MINSSQNKLSKKLSNLKTMSYASKVSSKFGPSTELKIHTFGLSCGALWGDVDMYDPKTDGSYEAFFLESARKRAAVVKAGPTEKELEEEAERFRTNVERKEKLMEQARNKVESKVSMCACGCGRPAHLNPRPDFAGHCCGWCKKHGGKRGHGEACGK